MKRLLNIQYETVGGLLLIIYIFLAFIVVCSTFADETITGTWRGPFPMGANLTVMVHLENTTHGRIQMFENANQLQDDELSDINISGDRITFTIPAKQTTFSGTVQDAVLSGTFTFPDGSLHKVRLTKETIPSFMDADQPVPSKKISTDRIHTRDELLQDLETLEQKLFHTHPNPYTFEKKVWFDSTIKDMKNHLSDNSELDFFRTLAPLVARVGCAHTGIRLSPQSEHLLKNTPSFLPLQVFIQNDSAYVLKSYDQYNPISPGCRLLTINGTPIKKCIATISRCLPADGYNRSAIQWQIRHHFNWLYALYIETPDSFSIQLMDENNKPLFVKIPAVPFDVIEQHRQVEHEFDQEVPLFKVNDETSYALLTFTHFSYPDFDRYHLYLKEQFRLLKENNIQSLIIDLRGNSGGHPLFAAELLSYLVHNNFTYFAATDIPEFDLLSQSLPAKEEAFSGQVLILVDGGCLSTTGHFLSLVQYHKAGTLIGETPGSSFYCFDNSVQISLPHTGIQANIPQSIFKTAVKGYTIGEELKVDYGLEPTFQDVINERDVVFEKALSLMEK